MSGAAGGGTGAADGRPPSARTRLCGIVGWPVGHSLSPAMQEAAFAALGLDLRYLAFPVEPARLAAALAGAGALGVLGLNVTVPHKEAALALCRPDDEAARIGAVNTLVFDGPGPPRGLNTDAHGVTMLLAEAGVEVAGREALVLGAGGAARAAAYALVTAGARVTVTSRRERRIAFAGLPAPAWIPWARAADRAPSTQLLVDATGRSLGDGPADDLAALPADAAVVDLVVRPTTRLVEAARARGLVAAGGAAMLLHQGARALTAWTGLPAPIEVMRRALDHALGEALGQELRASCSR